MRRPGLDALNRKLILSLDIIATLNYLFTQIKKQQFYIMVRSTFINGWFLGLCNKHKLHSTEAGRLLRRPSTCATAYRELLLHVLSKLVLWSGTNGSVTYITGTHEISNSLDIHSYIHCGILQGSNSSSSYVALI